MKLTVRANSYKAIKKSLEVYINAFGDLSKLNNKTYNSLRPYLLALKEINGTNRKNKNRRVTSSLR